VRITDAADATRHTAMNLFQTFRRSARRMVRRFAYHVEIITARFPDIQPEFFELSCNCQDFTMTSMERVYADTRRLSTSKRRTFRATSSNGGVWRGGSSMMATRTLPALSEKPW
jgi:hypothetical protein